MTLKEFATAYGVPYHIVYEASYKVQAISTMRKDREYPEHDLFDAVYDLLTERVEKHTRMLENTTNAMTRMVGRRYALSEV